MMRHCAASLLTWFMLYGAVAAADENPPVLRGGVMAREFSEEGRLYVDDDALIHFRTDQRLYYFSHMYYIRNALEAAGVVRDGKITCEQLLRITGNYSKAQYVYNFLEEAPLRGSQIMWIDRVEKVDPPSQGRGTPVPLFDGKSLEGWSVLPMPAPGAPSAWQVKDNVLSGSAAPVGGTGLLLSGASFTDFELSFEYRSSWRTSASLLLRADENGEGIALGMDHIDGGTIGFPKADGAASRPFKLHETREERGVGAAAHHHLQYEGRFNYDAIARDNLIQCCKLGEFLTEWDSAFWNVVRIRCSGPNPEITVWINGFQVNRFHANEVKMSDPNPAHMGAMEHFVMHPAGRIGFAVHSTQEEAPGFLLREIRVKALK
ncbi:MAG: DUF1080 domain-containing protein [Verrucomicrobia bacterium]|nr:DUF1080 domain-containing protein [Verrucomicrobiota bacterium]